LDVTSDESVKKAAKFVRQHLPQSHRFWALVNNAGVLRSEKGTILKLEKVPSFLSCYGPDAWTPLEEYKEAMEVNCWGCIRCTHVSGFSLASH
jgi:NAD(P)-dependent dehydrogenase (short-subunit alcohol dehydrogenase family)